MCFSDTLHRAISIIIDSNLIRKILKYVAQLVYQRKVNHVYLKYATIVMLIKNKKKANSSYFFIQQYLLTVSLKYRSNRDFSHGFVCFV